eukprot:3251744-Pyramimonas_sp.AAC.1
MQSTLCSPGDASHVVQLSCAEQCRTDGDANHCKRMQRNAKQCTAMQSNAKQLNTTIASNAH